MARLPQGQPELMHQLLTRLPLADISPKAQEGGFPSMHHDSSDKQVCCPRLTSSQTRMVQTVPISRQYQNK